MNAQEAARILAKENDSVVVVGIRREENRNFTYPQGDSQIAPTVGNTLYDLMAENKWKGAKKWAQNANKIAKEEKLYIPHIERRQAVS